MPAPLRPLPAIRTIRFSRRVAVRCAWPGAVIPDWVVCDTVANGRRIPRGRDERTGAIYLECERSYPASQAQKLPEIRVRVRVAVQANECMVDRILHPAPARQKNSDFRGFLHRASPK